MTRRIVVDLSDLYGFFSRGDRISGIQRVVLNLATRLRRRNPESVFLVFFNPNTGQHTHLQLNEGLDDLEKLRTLLNFKMIRLFKPEKYLKRPFRRVFHRNRVRLLRLVERNVKPFLSPRRANPLIVPFEFQEGDIFLSLGAGWELLPMLEALEPLATFGKVTPVILIHDLTPILGVNGREGASREDFEKWFNNVLQCSRHFLTYSEATKADLQSYLETSGISPKSISVFSLAHEFIIRDKGDVREHVQSVIGQEYVLCVGLFIGRKNGNRLVRAWARLVDQLGAEQVPQLVLAGINERADLSAPEAEQLGSHLQIVHRPNDTELDILYRHALFTVYPSIYEGWGLPVGESLWHEKFCVTSNVSSMPEVGGQHCDYFNPRDVESMFEVLIRPILDRSYLRKRESEITRDDLITWDKAADYLFEVVHRMVQ